MRGIKPGSAYYKQMYAFHAAKVSMPIVYCVQVP